MRLPTVKSDAKSVRNFKRLLRENVRLAGGAGPFSSRAGDLLATITKDFEFSFKAGELQIIDGNWYVTHTGLLRLAEEEANRLNVRAQNDTVALAEDHVADAERGVVAAQSVLTDFRNKHLLVDPTKSSDSELETITALATEFAETTATIKETTLAAASSPTVAALKAQAEALQERIDAERAKLGGSDQALAGKVSQFELLTLNRDLADQTLAAAIESLELAREDARRQSIYVEEIVAPNLPDESTEPAVLRTAATFFVLGFAIFGVLWIITVGAQEHEQ